MRQMKETKILISCTVQDREWLKNLEKWENKGLLEDSMLHPELMDKRYLTKPEAKAYLLDIIDEADMVVILLGDHELPEHWVKAYLELCRSMRRRMICLRIPQSGFDKPEILKSYVELVFNPNAILSQLKRAKYNRENNIINESDMFMDESDNVEMLH